MNDGLRTVRLTQQSGPAASIRMLVGVLFVMTGVMKVVVPDLRAAFAGQLAAAGIPLQPVNTWLVPTLEIGVGMLLLLGLFTRIAATIAIAVMGVATYVHLVVHDPGLFPLQPQAPIIPIIVIVMCLYLLRSGSGSLSLDLHATIAIRRHIS